MKARVKKVAINAIVKLYIWFSPLFEEGVLVKKKNTVHFH